MIGNKIKKILNKISGSLLYLLYPHACPFCGRVLEHEEKDICGECEPLIPRISGPVCLKCGKEIIDMEAELCVDCKRLLRSYVRGFPALNYVAPLKESIGQFKYHNKKEYAAFFASEIIRAHGKNILDVSPDVLVPVPLHKKKMQRRGYNQAAVLAKELSRKLGIPVDENIIERCVNTLPQKMLSGDERENNIKKAFLSCKKCVEYKSVMLVDDIYTTGATIEACTRLLHDMGVKDVFYTSISIGRGIDLYGIKELPKL
ncbi:MAG: ComF family protein [Lachnospiraceae bacterium]|nr:ComF family protein [Lachnospiraceae bacterium]